MSLEPRTPALCTLCDNLSDPRMGVRSKGILYPLCDGCSPGVPPYDSYEVVTAKCVASPRQPAPEPPYDVLAAKVERETWFMLRGVWQGRITRLSTDCDVLRGALRDAGDAANQWRRDAEWFTRERDEARADLGSALAGIEDEKRALLGRLEAARAAACVASGYPKEEILVAIHRLRGQLQNALSVRNVQGVTLVAVEKELGSYVDRTGPEGWNAEVFLVDAIRQLKNALSISNDEIEVKRKKIGTLHDLLDTAKKETERVRADYTDLRARVDGVLRSVRAGAPAAGAPTSGAPAAGAPTSGAPAAGAPTSGAPAAAPAAAKGETK